MSVTVGTRTDGNLGRTKSDSVAATDLDTQVPAGEYNNLADGLIAVQTDHNLLAGVFTMQHYLRLAGGVANQWMGSDPDNWNSSTATNEGTGTDPAKGATDINLTIPVPCQLIAMTTVFTSSSASADGEIRAYKFTRTDGSSSTTLTQVGTDIDIADAVSTSAVYVYPETGLSVSFAAGDAVAVFKRHTATNSTIRVWQTFYFRTT